MQLHDMEEKQKRAYLKLYERVGNEISTKMNKSIHERQVEKHVESLQDQKLEAAELEYKQLVTNNKQKNQSTNLDELFRKYNI